MAILALEIRFKSFPFYSYILTKPFGKRGTLLPQCCNNCATEMIRVMSRLHLTFPPVVYPATKARVAEQVAEVGLADPIIVS